MAGFGWLAGLGQGAGGLTTGMDTSDKLAQQQQAFAQQDKVLAEQTRHNQAVESGSQVDLGSLYDATGMPRPAGMPTTKMPVAAADTVMKLIQAKNEHDLVRARSGQTADYLQGLGQPRPDPGTPEAPVSTPPSPENVRLSALAPLVRTGALGHTELGKQLLPPEKQGPFVLGENGKLVDAQGNRLDAEPEPPPAFTPPVGYRPVPAQDRHGNVSTRWEPPPIREKSLGERVAAAEQKARANPNDPVAKAELEVEQRALEVEQKIAELHGAGRAAAKQGLAVGPSKVWQYLDEGGNPAPLQMAKLSDLALGEAGYHFDPNAKNKLTQAGASDVVLGHSAEYRKLLPRLFPEGTGNPVQDALTAQAARLQRRLIPPDREAMGAADALRGMIIALPQGIAPGMRAGVKSSEWLENGVPDSTQALTRQQAEAKLDELDRIANIAKRFRGSVTNTGPTQVDTGNPNAPGGGARPPRILRITPVP